MNQLRFDQVLDAVEDLPADEQADLLEIMHKRIVERGRQQLIDDVREARAQLAANAGNTSKVTDIMREIES